MDLTGIELITASANMRKLRMEELLACWREWPFWLPRDRSNGHGAGPGSMGAQEWPLWERLLESCVPLPPRSASRWLHTHAELAGKTVPDLESKQLVLLRGHRAAARWGVTHHEKLGGHQWSICWRGADPATAEAARKLIGEDRFIDAAPGVLVATPGGAPPLCVLGLLLDAAMRAASIDGLVRAWQLARALHLAHAFCTMLPVDQRLALASHFKTELLAAVSDLSVFVDAELDMFAAGQLSGYSDDFLRSRSLPPSRLAELLQADQWLDQNNGGTADHYFDDLTKGFVLLSDSIESGKMLSMLPAGRAHRAGMDALLRFRPELLAELVWHPSFLPEGADGLRKLPWRRFDAPVSDPEDPREFGGIRVT